MFVEAIVENPLDRSKTPHFCRFDQRVSHRVRSSDSFCEHLPGAGRRARRRTDDDKSVHLPPDSSGGSFLSHVIRENRQNRPKPPATRCCCRRTDKLCRLSTSRGPSEKWFLSRVIRYRKFFLPASSVSWILAKPVVFVLVLAADRTPSFHHGLASNDAR